MADGCAALCERGRHNIKQTKSLSGEGGIRPPPVPISQDTAFPVQRQSALRHLANVKNHLCYSVFRMLGPVRILSKRDLSKSCQNPVGQSGGLCGTFVKRAPRKGPSGGSRTVDALVRGNPRRTDTSADAPSPGRGATPRRPSWLRLPTAERLVGAA